MLKVRGLALTTVLLLGCVSCGEPVTRQDNAANTTSTAASTARSESPTPTPGTPTATPTPTAPTTASVKAVGIKWQDEASGTPVTTIKVGGSVTWTIPAGVPHSLKRVAASADNGCDELDASFDSNLSPGQPVTRTFDKVGTFGYQCGIHKGAPNCKNTPGTGPMPGVIKVVP